MSNSDKRKTGSNIIPLDNKINNTDISNSKKPIMSSINANIMLSNNEEIDSGIRLRIKRIKNLGAFLSAFDSKQMYYKTKGGTLAVTKNFVIAVATFLTGYEIIEDHIRINICENDSNLIIAIVPIKDIYNNITIPGVADQKIMLTGKNGESYEQAHPMTAAYSKALRNGFINIIPQDVLALCKKIYEKGIL